MTLEELEAAHPKWGIWVQPTWHGKRWTAVAVTVAADVATVRVQLKRSYPTKEEAIDKINAALEALRGGAG